MSELGSLARARLAEALVAELNWLLLGKLASAAAMRKRPIVACKCRIPSQRASFARVASSLVVVVVVGAQVSHLRARSALQTVASCKL